MLELIFIPIEIVNGILSFFFMVIMLPFQTLPAGAGLTFISFLTGILFLYLFKKTSNQTAIKKVRDQMRASMLEIRIFQHDLGVVFRAQGRIFLQTSVYLRYSLVPIVFICIPLIFIVAHFNLYFGYRALKVDEATIISVQLKEGENITAEDFQIIFPSDVAVETPPVFIRSLNRIEWRIRPKSRGIHSSFYKFKDNNKAFMTNLSVSDSVIPVSPVKPSCDIVNIIANPTSSLFDLCYGKSSFIQQVRINYPARLGAFFGWNVHWLIPFFILTLIFGYAFKGIMGVEI